MSPEYRVVLNESNKRISKAEIEVILLPGEIRQDLRDELMIPHIAEMDLKETYGFYKAVKTLQRVFPTDIAEVFVRALMEGKVGTSISFKKIGPGKYEVISEKI